LSVQATALSGTYPAASCNIRIHAPGQFTVCVRWRQRQRSGPNPLNTWRYFSVTVPPGAAGWDLRIFNVTSGDPRLVVRRRLGSSQPEHSDLQRRRVVGCGGNQLAQQLSMGGPPMT